MQEFQLRAKEKWNENKKFLVKLRKKKPKKLDQVVSDIHDQVFSYTNCLDCANCCKTTGPLFTQIDISRISKHLRLKPKQFIDDYLRVDEDEDLVLKSLPCVFLDDDNYCSIYKVRPKACREYPHTDQKKFHQLDKITLSNTCICPAVYDVVEGLKAAYKL